MLQMGIQPEKRRTRKNNMGESVFPETDPISLFLGLLIYLLIKVRTTDPHVTLKFPLVSMCNKRYISKPKNKEIGLVSGKPDSPVSFFLVLRFSG